MDQLSALEAVPSNDFPRDVIRHTASRRKSLVDPDTSDVEQASPSGSIQKEEGPPDGGYGWVCVICVWFINAHTWGVSATYSVFLNYYLSNNYFAGTSYLGYAFVGGLSMSMGVFISPLATWIIYKFGTRTCLHIGVFLQTVSLIAVSFAHLEYQLVLAQGVCFGVGMGFVFVGSVGIVPQWFSTKRSLATALAASGSGAGGLTYSLATQRVIDTLGLPWAFRILGIVSCVVNLIASNVLRDRSKANGTRINPFDWRLFKRPEFALFQGYSFLAMLGYVVVLFSLPRYATSMGLSAKQGSIVGAILNAGQMIGRPIAGLASDRWGRLNIATLFTFLCGVFCLAFWIPSRNMGLLSFFAVIGGSLVGTFWSVAAPVAAEVVGLQDLPGALSMTWLTLTPAMTVAEAIALELRKQQGTDLYINAQVFTAMMYIGGSACLWLVRAWKVGEMEEIARLKDEPVEKVGVYETGEVEGEGKLASEQHTRSVAAKSWELRSLARRLIAIKRV